MVHLISNKFDHFHEKHPAFFSIFVVILGYFFFNLYDASIKSLKGQYSIVEVLFWSSSSLFLWSLIFGFLNGFKRIWRTTYIKHHIFRAIFVGLATFAGIIGVKNLPLANFYAIIFLSPLTTVLMGWIFLRDELTLKKLIAILIGFSGILTIIGPAISFDFKNTETIGAIATLGLVLFASICVIIVRSIGTRESKTMFLLTGASGTFTLSVILYFINEGFTPISLKAYAIFAVIGFLSATGRILVNSAYQIAPNTSTVAPFHYSQIIGGVALGYIFWDEVPTYETIIGAIIVILSGLWVLYQEK